MSEQNSPTKKQSDDLLLRHLDITRPEQVSARIEGMEPAALAQLLSTLPLRERERLWVLIPEELQSKVLRLVQQEVRTSLLHTMQPGKVAKVASKLDGDDAADLLQELPEDLADTVLSAMDEQHRRRLGSLLSYPPDSAGGLMDTRIVPLRSEINLRVVQEYLLRLGDLPSGTDRLMVVNRADYFLGTLELSKILTLPSTIRVSDCMDTETKAFNAGMPASEVARRFAQQDLVSAPVVDQSGRLVGRITVDDVLDLIQEQADQRLLKMAGLRRGEDIFSSVLHNAKRRMLWLGLNLLTAFLASWVIGRFEDTIQQLVALAVLMPVVASMGGIAGSQTLAIVIRTLAVGQLGYTHAIQLVRNELLVGLLNGMLWAVLVAVIAGLWFQHYWLGVIFGIAMLVNLSVAALSGTIIPLLLHRMGIDPALAGGVILTTVTDVIGFMTFLGLGSIFLVG